MAHIAALDQALAHVEQADTQLEELCALYILGQLTERVVRHAFVAALLNFSNDEIAATLGITPQAVSKRRVNWTKISERRVNWAKTTPILGDDGA